MKIDCPHCGVHGSVDDSLAGKKLRCPQCSKVFLVTEDILPEVEDVAMVHQELLSTVAVVSVDEPEATVESEDIQQCSGCKQSFAALFLEEVDSKLYCTLCRPDTGSDQSYVSEDSDNQEDFGEELLEIDEADFSDDNSVEAGGDILDFMEDDESGEAADGSARLEACSGCGESLHPDFLETIEGQRYCALCAPQEGVLEDGSEMEESFLTEVSADSFEEDDSDREPSEGTEEDFLKEPCCVCGENFHLDFMQKIDSQLYCGICQPEVVEVVEEVDTAEEADFAKPFTADYSFSVGELLKEAWQKTKGAKGAVWGAVILMYLLLFGLSFGGTLGLQQFYKGTDPTIALGVSTAVELFVAWLSVVMTGGIMLIGVRRAKEQRVSWRMVFSGFPRAFSITIAILLEAVLIALGFVLLVLPGIYLMVSYVLALPLIIDKGMGPWEALKASRKAVHKKWWTVLGMYILMLLLYMVSAIPLGLGLIWTLPMFYVLVGVLYVRLFGVDAGDTGEVFTDEDSEEDFEAVPEETEYPFEGAGDSELTRGQGSF